MERKTKKLDFKMKVMLLEIVNSGQITPEQSDEIIPALDIRGLTFKITDIYNNTDENE